jgi:hypothetical protein
MLVISFIDLGLHLPETKNQELADFRNKKNPQQLEQKQEVTSMESNPHNINYAVNKGLIRQSSNNS